MKRNINYILSFLLMAFVVSGFTACVNDDDYSIPDFVVEEPDVTVNFTIANALELVSGTPTRIESEEPLYLEGYVVSSDEAGNFHKNLVIQDLPENPTAGITISTHATDMYTFFEPGRKVYVRVDGLYVGVYRGLPSLGESGDEVERMSVEEFDERVLRSNTKEEIVPTVISMEQVSDSHLNTLIQFNNVEFPANYDGLTYANPNDNFGVDRTVKDCFNNTVIMRNSGYADFKEELLPTGNGTLVSVLSVFNGTYQLLIRDTEDVDFEGERCEDDTPPADGAMPFRENFSTHPAGIGSYVDLPGWTNVNVSGGERRYEVREYSGNKYTQISAFGTEEDPFEAWLVTPGVTLDKPNPILMFDTKDGHFNGDALTLHISTDFDGDVTTATWTDITDQAVIPTGHTNWQDEFTNSGAIDLSEYADQEVFIAFRYLGGDFNVTTTYQIDNIEIKSGQ